MIFIIIYASLLVAAQLGLKTILMTAPSRDTWNILLYLLLNKYFYCFFILYALSIVLWVIILGKYNLIFAYSSAFSVCFILFNFLSYYFLGAQITLNSIVGSVIILIGALIFGKK